MKKRILLIFLAAMVVTALFAQPAQAHHYLYQAERPICQDYGGLSPQTDNCVLVWWWWGETAYWWADPNADGGQFIQQVRTAVDNWKAKFTEGYEQRLPLSETSSQSLSDIRFWLAPGLCGGSPGCFAVSAYENRSPPNGDEKASYMKTVEVYLNSSIGWLSSGYRTKTIAHELGHIYGLGEVYDEDTNACDPDVTSIMDGNTTQGGYYVPCDIVYGPADLDAKRVKAFWGGWDSGTPENLKRSEPISSAIGQGTWIITPWQDFAWAEQVHQMDWYWSYSSSGPFNNWYRGETVTNDIGVHFYTAPRTMRRDVDRADYPSVPAGSWSIVCGKTWSVPFQRWGNTRCSNAVQLS